MSLIPGLIATKGLMTRRTGRGTKMKAIWMASERGPRRMGVQVIVAKALQRSTVEGLRKAE